jgi:hypothetical protein
LTIPDVGVVKADEEREMPEGFNNVNFKRVEKKVRKEKEEEEKVDLKEEIKN